MNTEDWLHLLILFIGLPLIRIYFTRKRRLKEEKEYYEQARKDYYEGYVRAIGASDESPVPTDEERTQTRTEEVGRD